MCFIYTSSSYTKCVPVRVELFHDLPSVAQPSPLGEQRQSPQETLPSRTVIKHP